MPAARRLRWWTELPLIIAVYALYSAGRLVARGDTTTAVEHGLAILRFEKTLSLNAEHPLNRLFTDAAWLGVPADYAYAVLHYLVTPAVLIWLWRHRGHGYRAMRTWLMLSTVIGLIGFTLFPTCPPRLLDPAYGFVDTMAQYGDYGWWSTEASAPEGLGGLTNQYAAMPSLHVGWALWCAVAVWLHGGGHRRLRALVFGYPVVIMLVVMGTANHYLLDAAAGCAAMGLGLLLTRPSMRLTDAVAARFRALRGTTAGAVAVPGTATATVPGTATRGAGRTAGGARPSGSGPARPGPKRSGTPAPGTGLYGGAERQEYAGPADLEPYEDRARDGTASGARAHVGAADVGAGCQTAARTAETREAPEARADDHFPRQDRPPPDDRSAEPSGRSGAAGHTAPAAH